MQVACGMLSTYSELSPFVGVPLRADSEDELAEGESIRMLQRTPRQCQEILVSEARTETHSQPGFCQRHIGGYDCLRKE